ncbi:flagellar basal body-associated FliL family protein [Clostridium bowmanii]|uniref:flagellar basal body-associated FliL family protein n=1 Tax=Clostridium bowmanii TaxID=132925 RepID=UPI001C0D6C37|nr:flagellar basal body-associated FliL family protein [Clostridium bowmanii]MBU3190575.1 flagellar basal body-associated FliL family protein [Clostridium bowmanii]MCA1075106.1 flagellar basal body-associated FliL family protein [Clostridium bowmanii]
MSEKTKGGKGSKIVIILLLVLIVVGGAAFGGMYFFGKKAAGTTATSTKAVESNEVTYSLDEFLVNLTDEDGRRYLKVTVFIGYEENADLTAELDTKKPIIRDAVIATLRAKKTTDFSGTGIDVIKNELISKVNPTLTKGKISHIYFNEILVQ